MEYIVGMLYGSLGITILSVLFFFRIPHMLQTLLNKRIDKEMNESLERSKQQFQKEVAEAQNENAKSLQDLKNKFQIEYQNAEQVFTIRLDSMKKKYTILPEMYNKICIFEAKVKNLEVSNGGGKLKKYLAEVMNYNTRNRLSIDEEEYLEVRRVQNLIVDFYTARIKSEKVSPDSPLLEEYSKNCAELGDEVDKAVENLAVYLRDRMEK
ncbi:hypothetical protein HCB27_05075 [Listeria booriae]|uniref:Uncharacterized protein n=1 Tax=Listeria booriae TaxID=1552123 RepID=A0A7X1D870_9LIST|nr:hypothetical protein [Listeria booriae]MBC2175976.1 hypothetical protein [Listeria booriae]